MWYILLPCSVPYSSALSPECCTLVCLCLCRHYLSVRRGGVATVTTIAVSLTLTLPLSLCFSFSLSFSPSLSLLRERALPVLPYAQLRSRLPERKRMCRLMKTNEMKGNMLSVVAACQMLAAGQEHTQAGMPLAARRPSLPPPLPRPAPVTRSTITPEKRQTFTIAAGQEHPRAHGYRKQSRKENT